MIHFVFIILVFFSSMITQAIEFSDVKMSGSGCVIHSNEKSPLKFDFYPLQKKLILPLQFQIKKHNSKSFLREKCSLSLPVKLNEKEKIILNNLNQNLSIVQDKKIAQTFLNLEVFISNGQSQKIKFENLNKLKRIQSSDFKLESKCGESFNLRAEISSFSKGKDHFELKTENLEFDLMVLKCR